MTLSKILHEGVGNKSVSRAKPSVTCLKSLTKRRLVTPRLQPSRFVMLFLTWRPGHSLKTSQGCTSRNQGNPAKAQLLTLLCAVELNSIVGRRFSGHLGLFQDSFPRNCRVCIARSRTIDAFWAPALRDMVDDFLSVLDEEGMLSPEWHIIGSDTCADSMIARRGPTGFMVFRANGKGALFPEFERLWPVLEAAEGIEVELRQRYKLDNMREPLAKVQSRTSTENSWGYKCILWLRFRCLPSASFFMQGLRPVRFRAACSLMSCAGSVSLVSLEK